MRAYFFHIFCLMMVLLAATQSPMPVYGQNKKITEWYDKARKMPKTVYFILPKKTVVADGAYISYYQNGQIQKQGQYTKGQASGNWTFFYESGKIKMEGSFVGKKKTGPWKYFFENGNINKEGNFDINKPIGFWKYYYENGKLKSEGELRSDTLAGEWKYFYETGKAKAQAFYMNGRGPYREYFEQGGLKMQGIIANNKSDSIWQYFYENGNIRAKGIEKVGLKQGLWQFYHPNGKLSSEGNFDKGQYEGVWQHYYASGKLNSTGSHKKGNKEGSWKLYYESGLLLGEGNFDQGSGTYTEYYENGKLRMQGKIQSEQYQGLWNYYYDEGTKEGQCSYKDGLGEYESYYRNGKIKMKGWLKNGQKTGIWQLYDEAGKLSGYYKTYYEEGYNKAAPPLAPPDTITAVASKTLTRPNIILDKPRMRYFRPKINETTWFILSANPLALIDRSLPVYLEYFIESRIGFELMLIGFRRPVFGSHDNLPANEVHSNGYAASIATKFYHEDVGVGHYWLGPELRFTDLDYKIHAQDGFTNIHHSAKDTKSELCLLVGTKFIKAKNRSSGYAFEIFGGLGMGYRSSSLPDPTLFGSYITNRHFTFPIRLGGKVGYMF